MSTMHMLIGLPATGKSTYMSKFNNHVIASSDLYLENIGPTYDEAFKTHMKAVTQQLKYALEQNLDIVVDRTNLKRANRESIIKPFREAGYTINGVVFGQYLTIHEWIERLNSREGKTIPPHVLFSMASNFEYPVLDEGFDHIMNYEELALKANE